MPRVSVVIPTYERPDLLERLLKSVYEQTYKDFEVIVVDDNSSRREEYKDLLAKFSDVKYFVNEGNKGAPYSRNRGIQMADGELIALVDDDDEWLPEKLEGQVEIFDENPDHLGIVYTWTKAIKNNKVCFEYASEVTGHAIRDILLECFIPSPSVLVRKTALFDAGLFDVNMPSCQDWDMWTRILAKGYFCLPLKSFQTIYHKHERDSIGESSKAKQGYRLFYRKHALLYFRYHTCQFLKRAVKHLVKVCLSR